MASQTVPADPGSEEDRFQALMLAIAGCQNTLTAKIDTLQMEFGLLRRDMDKMRDRMTEAERRIGDSEDAIHDNRASIHTLQAKVKILESRAEDSENRSRRNNLRLVGLPEGAEGRDPTAFTETLLRALLPQAPFSPHFVVERAHRMPPVRGPPGAPPRTFIFRLLNFRDRDLALREARKIPELRFENTKIMMFPDYSVDTQRLRRTFDHVKAQLRLKGLKYSMLFPARLRVIDGESSRYFTSPEEASRWLDTLPQDRRGQE